LSRRSEIERPETEVKAVLATLLKYAILLVLIVFLIYPIGYVFPGALVERGEPYAVILVQAGGQSGALERVLTEKFQLSSAAAGDAVANPPATLAQGKSLADALELMQAIRSAGGTARLEGSLTPTLFYVGQIFTSPFLWQCLAASLVVALATTLLTTLVTLPLAIWLTRFRFAGRAVLSALVLVPLILPPFVGAIGFRQLFSRFGTLNLWLLDAGIIARPIDWLGGSGLEGLWALVVMEVLHLYPIMYLNVAAALANVDPSLEEAGRNLGSSEWTLFRRVTFPLVLPGYFAGAAIVFVWAFTDLGTPIVLGYRRIVAYQIFEKLSEAETNPLGYALVLMTLLLTAGLYALARWITGRGQYAMVSKGGVGAAARPAGRLRTAVILGYGGTVTLLAVLPHIAVVFTSVAAKWSFTPLPTKYTGEYFALAVTHKLAGLSIWNSVKYSSCSTVVDIALGVSIAYLVSRRPSWLSRLLDGLAMLPLALPGLVLAFGYLTCYYRPAQWLDQLGFEWLAANLQPQKSPELLLIVAYAIRRLPYMSRAALAGLEQTATVFEEAAENLGAGRWRIMRQVTLPLIAANIVAGSILTFSFAVLEVSDSIMLAQRENYFPITKAIYILLGRPDDGPYIASAMGVLGMILLAAALVTAAVVLGRRMGELFRA
jgi:iron(III) transport system permease protein